MWHTMVNNFSTLSKCVLWPKIYKKYYHHLIPTGEKKFYLIKFIHQVIIHKLLHYGFYPLNKSDTFTGCYFHTVKNIKISKLWVHIMYWKQYLRFKRDIFKNQRKYNKQKIQCFWCWIWNLFHSWDSIVSYFHSCFALKKIKKILSHMWNKFNIKHQIIEFSLFIS